MELVFDAPPGRRIKWASLGGFFTAHQGDAAVKTNNQIWCATDNSDDWKQLYASDVPSWNNHWHYAYDKDVVLDQPAESLRVRYVGDPGVNGVRVNLHSLPPRSTGDEAVVVTHGFELDGKLVQRRFSFDKPADYTIDCEQVPKNAFVQITVPSDFQSNVSRTP